MGYAFEICEEDVYIALQQMGHENVEQHEKVAGDIVVLEGDRVEKAALYGDDMDEQTDYAIQEIKEILKEKGFKDEG